METEFYRSPSDLLPTFSLVLAASLVGVGTFHRLNRVTAAGSWETPVSPTCAHYAYYEPAESPIEPAQQAKALESFAENLLAQTEDNPQEIVEVLNRHFWELV